MTAKRRQFSVEFKQEVVRQLLASGRPLTHMARELGIRPKQLHEWRRQWGPPPSPEPGAAPAAPGAGAAPEREAALAEVRRLRQELERVRHERDFLKKAAAFFASASR